MRSHWLLALVSGALFLVPFLFFVPPATARHPCPVRQRPPLVLRAARALPVLTYHHVVPASLADPGNPMAITVERLRDHLDYLREQGYYTPTLAEVREFLAGRLRLPERSVLITFDDGYESVYQYAHPLLCQRGLRAVLFKITNRRPRQGAPFDPARRTHTSWEQVQEMVESGVWELGNHGHAGHDPVGGQPPYTVWDEERILQDLVEANRQLVQHGLPAPVAVAYPFGAYNAHTAAAARRAGLQLGFTAAPGRVRPGMDPLHLPRLTVLPQHDRQGLRWLLNAHL